MAGFDYQGTGAPFATIALNRQQQLIKATTSQTAKHGTITVTVLDVATGTTTVSTPENRNPKPTHTHDPVTAASYSGPLRKHPSPVFKPKQDGVMSILDLYETVEEIGENKSAAGSVVEVSVFSHGWDGGPILVNSGQDADHQPGGIYETLRDPNDHDGRKFKDFANPNMTDDAQALFRAAWDSKGFWWTWGCDFPASYFQVTHQFTNQIKQTKPDNLRGTDKFHFKFTQEQADSFYPYHPTFFPQERTGRIHQDGSPYYQTLEFDRTLQQIRKFFRSGAADTYSTSVATAIGREARGAFPGTAADYEQIRRKVLLRGGLMVIPRNYGLYGDNYTDAINMWVNVLGFAQDPLGKGYGVFQPP